MNRWQWGSLTVVLFCVVLIILWDIIALHFAGRKATISYLLTMMTYHWPFGVLLLGAVAGHLFWYMTPFQEDIVLIKVIEITVDSKGNTVHTRERMANPND